MPHESELMAPTGAPPTYGAWLALRSSGWTPRQAWRIQRQVRRGVPEAVALRVVQLGLTEHPRMPAWPLAWCTSRCECGHAAHAHPYQAGPGTTWSDCCLAAKCLCSTFRQVSR
jgi:hypothetical protein